MRRAVPRCGKDDSRRKARQDSAKAAFIKWQTPIAFANCFAAATAITYQAELVTGDPEFEKLDVEISICWLPRKK